MVFKEGSPLYSTEMEQKQGEKKLYINYIPAPFIPSISDSELVMSRTVDALSENPDISQIVFVQQRMYLYPSSQTLLLAEISRLYNFLVKTESLLSPEKLAVYGNSQEIYADMTYILTLLKQDPLKCYREIKFRVKNLKSQQDSHYGSSGGYSGYIRFLERIISLMGELQIVKRAIAEGVDIGINRDYYKTIFRPDTLPNFTFTRLVAQFPEGSEFVDQYEIKDDVESFMVTILKRKTDGKYFYHAMPTEYTLSEEQHQIVNLARNVLVEHRPKAEEFVDPERTRQVFFNVARDLISELSRNKNVPLSYKEISKLSRVLVRHTIGFGLIEVLLMDEKLQDIMLNAPVAQNPVFVKHEKYDECVTNIIPSYEDADSWAAKLRLQSGRPLDEANPILDTELLFGGTRARVAAIKEPLSPNGLAYAFRRHRDQPWTLPLFIKNKMINSFAAGLLSFMIDGSRTLLVAGTRSAGKTSLLGSLLLEIMPKYRVLVVEDTLELPVDALRKIGYNILRMKVRSSLVSGSTEIEASEGIRTSLRLGDSALIVGEVRSSEAKALYEAMRVGALANVVAGTIHGDSPYGVFDRVVNDLGVPETSFKATDLIVVTNPVKTPDGLHSVRRVVSVTEVRKHWIKDPLAERGFVDLMRYNVETDELEPTPELINGDSEIIKSIAGSVKGWAGNWDAVYDNIILRGMIKQEIVEASAKLNKPELLEASFNSLSNSVFHKISEEVRSNQGLPSSDSVFPLWKKWFYESISDY